ncbi:MAG: DUF3325 domain-containing protein [Pseudomonadota bacterium]
MSTLADFGLILLAYALCTLGCSLLAFNQIRHWRAIVDDRKAKPPRTAMIGWALVIAALPICIARDGGSFAALLWPLIFAAGAMSVAILLTYKPTWFRSLALLVSPEYRSAR